jgi:hypoxanthine phosphoribosyltransferase
MGMMDDVLHVLISKEELEKRIKELGEQISHDYAGKNLLLVGVLKGSVMFMTDLMKNISIHAAIDFMAVSSYGSGTESSGVVKIVKDLDVPLESYDVLIVEDILDSGVTLNYIMGLLADKKAKSIGLCTLLNKPDRRKIPVKLDYEGFSIPDEFVIGYGLDYNERYRNLPFIGVLKPAVYSSK